MHVALFVVGPPGAGKTTSMRALLGQGYSIVTHPETAKIKWTLNHPFCFVGHYGVGTYDGSDTIPLDSWKINLEYWEKELLPNYKYTVFDGDRFAHKHAKKFLEDRGVMTVCIHLSAPDKVLNERRTERGADQDPAWLKRISAPGWLKGRVTKARNFADLFKEETLLEMFGGEEPSHNPSRLLNLEVVGISPKEVSNKALSLINSFSEGAL